MQSMRGWKRLGFEIPGGRRDRRKCEALPFEGGCEVVTRREQRIAVREVDVWVVLIEAREQTRAGVKEGLKPSEGGLRGAQALLPT